MACNTPTHLLDGGKELKNDGSNSYCELLAMLRVWYTNGPVDYALLYTVYKVQPVGVSHCWTKVKTRSARSITSSSLMFEKKKNNKME